MSQSGFLTAAGGGGTDLLTLTGDVGGVVTPDGAGNINILGGDGVLVTGDPGANTLTITVDETIDTVTTTDDTPTVIFSQSVDPGVLFHASSTVIGALDDFSAGIGGTASVTVRRTAAGAATLIGAPLVNFSEDTLGNPFFTWQLTGNTLELIVAGIAATTINWDSVVRIF